MAKYKSTVKAFNISASLDPVPNNRKSKAGNPAASIFAADPKVYVPNEIFEFICTVSVGKVLIVWRSRTVEAGPISKEEQYIQLIQEFFKP